MNPSRPPLSTDSRDGALRRGRNVKRCTKCGRELPLSEFNRDKSRKTGHKPWCKHCTAEYQHERYATGADLEERLRACSRNPTPENARMATRAAIRAGRLTRPHVCSGCGCTDQERRIEAHHADYTRPLDVIWLCTSCHRYMDQQRREREALGVETKRERVEVTLTVTGEPVAAEGVEVIDLNDHDLMTPKKYAEATGQKLGTVHAKLGAGRIAGAVRHGRRWLIDPALAMA